MQTSDENIISPNTAAANAGGWVVVVVIVEVEVVLACGYHRNSHNDKKNK